MPGVTEDGAIAQALEGWLAERYPDATSVSIPAIARPKAGFSNDTLIFSAVLATRDGEQNRRLVLRRGGAEQGDYPVQPIRGASSVELQYRVMEALSAGSAPLAPLVGWEPSEGPLGAPFFVMEYVAGPILPDFPSYAQEGFFVEDASPKVRRRFIESGLSALADIHRFDWNGGGLRWLARGKASGRMRAQLDLWRTHIASTPSCHGHRLLNQSLQWLEDQLPTDEPDAVLSWGDARIQNMIFSDEGHCRAIMDWEGAAILPPEVDMGWWLGVDRFVHEVSGATRLEGELSRMAQIAFYEQKLARPLHRLPYYRVFAAFRTLAQMIPAYERMKAKGVNDMGSVADNPFEGLLEAALARGSDDRVEE